MIYTGYSYLGKQYGDKKFEIPKKRRKKKEEKCETIVVSINSLVNINNGKKESVLNSAE